MKHGQPISLEKQEPHKGPSLKAAINLSKGAILLTTTPFAVRDGERP